MTTTTTTTATTTRRSLPLLLVVRGDHLRAPFEPISTSPPGRLDSNPRIESAPRPGLVWGSYLPHANLACTRGTSSCVLRSPSSGPCPIRADHHQQVSQGRAALCCAELLCCAVLCCAAIRTRCQHFARPPKSRPQQGAKVCVVSKPPRPGDAATPASSGAQDQPTNHQATKL